MEQVNYYIHLIAILVSSLMYHITVDNCLLFKTLNAYVCLINKSMIHYH